jgi:hypothetical protein
MTIVPASLPAERMIGALKPMLLDAGRGAGSAFERDAAVVLRRVEESVRRVRGEEPDNPARFSNCSGGSSGNRSVPTDPPTAPPLRNPGRSA